MPIQDELNRSWLRRGWASPTPTWGLSVPELWAETLVEFYRRDPALNEYGTFSGAPEVVFWSVRAHCELVEARAQEIAYDFPFGTMLKKNWSIYAKYPLEPDSQMPKEGDHVRFTSVDGLSVDIQIKHVYVKDSLADHVQVETLEFE